MFENALPHYEPPVVLTYTDEEILDELGPAITGGYLTPIKNSFGSNP
jgi:hypothetical protein